MIVGHRVDLLEPTWQNGAPSAETWQVSPKMQYPDLEHSVFPM